MTYITWFDPGLRTGIVTGWFDDAHHYQPRRILQVNGGPKALDEWVQGEPRDTWMHPGDIIGCEKFIPRPIEGGSHTLESTIPLVGEGVLCARGVMPFYPEGNWQPAKAQTLMGGKTPEERKRRSDDLLKAKGLWLTGSDVGMDDADDAISATKHILHFLCNTLRHRPTRDWLYGEEN